MCTHYTLIMMHNIYLHNDYKSTRILSDSVAQANHK